MNVTRAESIAILEVLRGLEKYGLRRDLILSDSFCAISTVKSLTILRIRELYWSLSDRGCDVRFIWIPANRGIRGNERVDLAVRSAAFSNGVRLKYTLGAMHVWRLDDGVIWEDWQEEWEKFTRVKTKDYTKICPKVNRFRFPWFNGSWFLGFLFIDHILGPYVDCVLIIVFRLPIFARMG